jgi:hypothetical protein
LIFGSGLRYISIYRWHPSHSTEPDAEAGFVERFGSQRLASDVSFHFCLSYPGSAKPYCSRRWLMAQDKFERILTTIFSADVVGYCRLMGENQKAVVKAEES